MQSWAEESNLPAAAYETAAFTSRPAHENVPAWIRTRNTAFGGLDDHPFHHGNNAVSAEGFEPPTSRFVARDSDPIELRGQWNHRVSNPDLRDANAALSH